jgi:hypothetical protein
VNHGDRVNILKGRTSIVAILSLRRIYLGLGLGLRLRLGLGLGNAIYSNGLDGSAFHSVTAFLSPTRSKAL